MAPGAKTQNKTPKHQSISVLPDRTRPIIPPALMLVHGQNKEIKSEQGHILNIAGEPRTACLCQIHRRLKTTENTTYYSVQPNTQ